ncbi:MAG: rod shape-determining protein RodA, partial [Polaribacter sp.]
MFAKIDWLLILLYIILVVFGWFNIYAASSMGTSHDIFDFSTKYGKQILWIGLSIPLIILLLFLNSRFYERFSGVLYLISLILLAGVLVFGKTINNATSWYSFGSFSLQPSEFAKAFTALGVAKLMSDRQYDLKLFKNQIKAFIIIFLPAFFIALQPDMGSVLVYFAFFFVLNREGLTIIYILIGFLAGTLFLLTIAFGIPWVLSPILFLLTLFFGYNTYKDKYFFRYNWTIITITYTLLISYIFISPYIFNNVFRQHQRDRIEILLRLKSDNSNIGYNSHQAELTVSSGGFWGKGFLQGDRTQGHFVPEQHTDYIFSVVSEEWGFLGSSLVIIVFMIFILRIIYLSEKTLNKFGRIYGYGVASIFFFHVMINIGMVIGLFPTVGIP